MNFTVDTEKVFAPGKCVHIYMLKFLGTCTLPKAAYLEQAPSAYDYTGYAVTAAKSHPPTSIDDATAELQPSITTPDHAIATIPVPTVIPATVQLQLSIPIATTATHAALKLATTAVPANARPLNSTARNPTSCSSSMQPENEFEANSLVIVQAVEDRFYVAQLLHSVPPNWKRKVQVRYAELEEQTNDQGQQIGEIYVLGEIEDMIPISYIIGAVPPTLLLGSSSIEWTSYALLLVDLHESQKHKDRHDSNDYAKKLILYHQRSSS